MSNKIEIGHWRNHHLLYHKTLKEQAKLKYITHIPKYYGHNPFPLRENRHPQLSFEIPNEISGKIDHNLRHNRGLETLK